VVFILGLLVLINRSLKLRMRGVEFRLQSRHFRCPNI
jgi:hypothetical protein